MDCCTGGGRSGWVFWLCCYGVGDCSGLVIAAVGFVVLGGVCCGIGG